MLDVNTDLQNMSENARHPSTSAELEKYFPLTKSDDAEDATEVCKLFQKYGVGE